MSSNLKTLLSTLDLACDLKGNAERRWFNRRDFSEDDLREVAKVAASGTLATAQALIEENHPGLEFVLPALALTAFQWGWLQRDAELYVEIGHDPS